MEENELRNKFNPEGSLLREQQKIMLYILQTLDRICREYDIKYWLCSGTLLGAVRHQSFIPWDDDLDIEMLEKDLQKLKKIILSNNVLPDDLVLQDKDTDSDYLYPFPKIRYKHSRIKEKSKRESSRAEYNGIFIDIFPLKKTNSFISSIANRIAIIYYSLAWQEKKRYRLLSRCVYIVLYKIIFPILNILALAIHKNNEMGHPLGMPFKYFPRFSHEILPLSYVVFEGIHFPAPAKVDLYLRRLYGHYMRIPDVTKIETHLSDVEIFLKK